MFHNWTTHGLIHSEMLFYNTLPTILYKLQLYKKPNFKRKHFWRYDWESLQTWIMINLNWHQEMKVQLNFWGTRQEDMRLTSCFVLTVGKDLSVLVADADETSCSDRKYFKIAFHCDHDRGSCWFYSSTSFSASNKRSLALVCFSHCCWQHLLRCFIELTLWVWAHLPASHMTCISL